MSKDMGVSDGGKGGKDGASPSFGGPGCHPYGAEPVPVSGIAGIPDASDEQLEVAAQKARRLVNALSAAELADIGVARFEADTAASDRVLMSNFEKTQSARRVLRLIEEEQARRAASRIEARSDQTPQAAEPEGREPDPKGDAHDPL